MAVRYLLEINTASYLIKGQFHRVRARLLKVPMAEVGISVVTEAELRFGVARRPEATSLKSVVEEFLLRVESLPWNSEAARHYARIRASLESEGEPIGNLDLMIAAHAVAAEVVLVTRDHVFRRGKGVEGWGWSK